MFANEERTIFGKIINYLHEDNHFIVAVDNDYSDYKEILSIDSYEVERFYCINPEDLINHRIYCCGTQSFDNNSGKWLTDIYKLEILVNIVDYLYLQFKDEEKTEPCI